MEEQKAAAAAARVKKGPVAKSLIVFDVKVWDAETDLDDLAAKVLAIKIEGLDWKAGYKKEPVAYKIEKLVIGCCVVDDLVSTDDIQEKIEAMEDLVQSVDIAAFQKL